MSGLQFDHIGLVVTWLRAGSFWVGCLESKSGPGYLKTRESAISMFTGRSKGASG